MCSNVPWWGSKKLNQRVYSILVWMASSIFALPLLFHTPRFGLCSSQWKWKKQNRKDLAKIFWGEEGGCEEKLKVKSTFEWMRKNIKDVGVHIWYLYYWEQREGLICNPMALFELWLKCHVTVIIEYIQMFLSIHLFCLCVNGKQYPLLFHVPRFGPCSMTIYDGVFQGTSSRWIWLSICIWVAWRIVENKRVWLWIISICVWACISGSTSQS